MLREFGLHTEAERIEWREESPRQRLRLTWVGVEVAWATGEEPSTDGLPTITDDGQEQLPADLASGSAFHRAKAWLFRGLVGRVEDRAPRPRCHP